MNLNVNIFTSSSIFYWQGGATSKISLTAYVLSAISEVKFDSSLSSKLRNAQSKARNYLERQASSLKDPYSLALTSYALYKSGSQNVDITLTPLEKLSKKSGKWNKVYKIVAL